MTGLRALLIGAVAGLVATLLLTLLLPHRTPRWMRSLIPPLVGVTLAYLIMQLI